MQRRHAEVIGCDIPLHMTKHGIRWVNPQGCKFLCTQLLEGALDELALSFGERQRDFMLVGGVVMVLVILPTV